MLRASVLICLALALLGGCASMESRLRARTADRETIQAAFASERAELRCLAAESCTWSHEAGCEARLEAFAAEDPLPEVRICALRTLGSLCSEEAREVLLRLPPRLSPALRRVFSEVAAACPSADLFLALAQDAEWEPLPADLRRPPASLEARVAWLQALGRLQRPGYRAAQALDRAEKELAYERAEATRRQEIRRLEGQAEAALQAGNWREAEEAVQTLVLLGAPSPSLLRRVTARKLLAADAALEGLLAKGAWDGVKVILSGFPHLYLLHPEVIDRYARERYEEVLPGAREVVSLARQGKTAAAQRKLDDLPVWEDLPHPLDDLIRLQIGAIVETMDRGAFEKAWNEAWLLRATQDEAYAIFLKHYARGRWREEGLDMSRAQFFAYLERVHEHAPPEAQEQLRRYQLGDKAREGDGDAALELLRTLAEDTDDHIEMCRASNEDRVPALLADKSIEEVSQMMELLAQHVTTVRARTALRAKRDEGKRLARGLRDADIPALKAKIGSCVDGALRMKQIQGARPGSEAHARLMRLAQETARCTEAYQRMIQPTVRQGRKCLRYIREAGALGAEMVKQ